MQPLTDVSYWDDTWAALPSARAVNIGGLRGRVNLAFHEFFTCALKSFKPGSTLIELGCAQSKWLPYFRDVHRLHVSGLDYSRKGCDQTYRLLGGVGEIYCVDMFDAAALHSKFDIVVSMGLVEHFDDTAKAVTACAAFAKPGGLVITTVPNMAGLVGWLQKLLNRSVYDKHKVLDAKALREAHAGLKVIQCGYLMSANFSVVNQPNKLIGAVLKVATVIIWVLRIPVTPFLSPYITCIACAA